MITDIILDWIVTGSFLIIFVILVAWAVQVLFYRRSAESQQSVADVKCDVLNVTVKEVNVFTQNTDDTASQSE